MLMARPDKFLVERADLCSEAAQLGFACHPLEGLALALDPIAGLVPVDRELTDDPKSPGRGTEPRDELYPPANLEFRAHNFV